LRTHDRILIGLDQCLKLIGNRSDPVVLFFRDDSVLKQAVISFCLGLSLASLCPVLAQICFSQPLLIHSFRLICSRLFEKSLREARIDSEEWLALFHILALCQMKLC
jgi:hypothetical protein